MINSVDLNISCDPVLISLAPFLLAVWVEVERTFRGSAGSAGPGFALGFF